MALIPEKYLLPLVDRPRFARRMVAVWREKNNAAGEQLHVNVMPGEWPDGVPMLASGVEVRFEERVGGAGGVMVLGRVGEVWRMSYQIGVTMMTGWTLDELAQVTFFAQVDDSKSIELWMPPDPYTGATHRWFIPRTT